MSLQHAQYFSEELNGSFLLTNTAGEHAFVSKNDFELFKSSTDKLSDGAKALLKSRFFLYEKPCEEQFKKIYEIKYRTKHSYLENES